jgi:hypothetical protein
MLGHNIAFGDLPLDIITGRKDSLGQTDVAPMVSIAATALECFPKSIPSNLAVDSYQGQVGLEGCHGDGRQRDPPSALWLWPPPRPRLKPSGTNAPTGVVYQVADLVEHDPGLSELLPEAVKGQYIVGDDELKDGEIIPVVGYEPHAHNIMVAPPGGRIVLDYRAIWPAEDLRCLLQGPLASPP